MLKVDEIIKRVPFDATNRNHRQVVYDFIKTGKWSQYFEVPRNCKNLPYQLMETILMQFDKWESTKTIQGSST